MFQNTALPFMPSHLAFRHYLSSAMIANIVMVWVAAFKASAKLPSFGGYSYVT